MAKYFQRLGATKKNFSFSVKIIALTAEVKEEISFSVLWKRGPQTEETNLFTVNPSQTTVDINKTFTRISVIYKDEKKGKYLKKTVRSIHG